MVTSMLYIFYHNRKTKRKDIANRRDWEGTAIEVGREEKVEKQRKCLKEEIILRVNRLMGS